MKTKNTWKTSELEAYDAMMADRDRYRRRCGMLARERDDAKRLAQRVASLNPDAAEIGAGMLVQLVADAQRIIGANAEVRHGAKDVAVASTVSEIDRPKTTQIWDENGPVYI